MSEQVNIENAVGDDGVVAAEQPVGEQLRQAREMLGLQVGDIAQTLKLGTRQVEALESGDWQHLPGQTFIRGFVRNYARMVQLDSAPLMLQLDGVLEKPVDNLAIQESRPASMPQPGGTGSRRDRLVVLIGAVLVGLASLIYFLIPADLAPLRQGIQSLLDSMSRKEVPVTAPAAPAADPVFPPGATPQQIMNPQALAPAETSPSPAAPQAEAAPAVSSTATAPQMRFLFDKDSWLEVRDRDNKVVFSQRLTAGTEQVLSGQGPLSLTIGYAPGVRVFWHGQAIDLAPHTKGDVARLVLE
jgi:cytoskeleton protein RodZ